MRQLQRLSLRAPTTSTTCHYDPRQVRVQHVSIGLWRNLRDVELDIDATSRFLCLVGSNGSGKTSLLEVLAYASQLAGISGSTSGRRARPPSGLEHQLRVTLVAEDELPELPSPPSDMFDQPTIDAANDARAAWDGTLVAESVCRPLGSKEQPSPPWDFPFGSSSGGGFQTSSRLMVGGVDDERLASALGIAVTTAFSRRRELFGLFLDSDRVFPRPEIRDEEVVALARQNPGVNELREQLARENLYVEWIRSVLIEQQRASSAFHQQGLDAARTGAETIPVPEDWLSSFRTGVLRLLPHLDFVRPDPQERTLLFESSGTVLRFEDLSGGEREIVFLVGQVERFGVRQGVFLLDEPELHLNADLLRNWLGYLRDSVDQGQAWIATHALEAAEVAGTRGTLVLERTEPPDSSDIQTLGERPALLELAGRVGSPGFSLASKRFILIEGERPRGERERFFRLLDPGDTVQFLEAGGCSEVQRRFELLREFADETDQLSVGAIIDRDGRTDAQVEELEISGIMVLPVFEIENLLLHPVALDVIAMQAGIEDFDVLKALQDASDPQAGRWIWESVGLQEGWDPIPPSCSGIARRYDWAAVSQDPEAFANALVREFVGLEPLEARKRVLAVKRRADAYSVARTSLEELWRRCMGKEAAAAMAPQLGLKDSTSLEARVTTLWRDGSVCPPTERGTVSQYITELQAVQSRAEA